MRKKSEDQKQVCTINFFTLDNIYIYIKRVVVVVTHSLSFRGEFGTTIVPSSLNYYYYRNFGKIIILLLLLWFGNSFFFLSPMVR